MAPNPNHDNFVVDESGCWLWQGPLHWLGYGIVYARNRCLKAHRFHYERQRGPVPEGLELDHLCRVRRCVNPDHLEPVTHIENVHRGSTCKLRPDDVRAIHRQPEKRACDLAVEFGVSGPTISQIRSGQRWPDIYAEFHLQAHGPVTADKEGLAALEAPEPATHRGVVDEHDAA